MSRSSGAVGLVICGWLLIAGTAPAGATESGDACSSGLPDSRLALLDSKADRIEQTVSAKELMRAAREGGGHAGQDFLLTDPPVRGWFTVEHRIVRSPSDPTMFCDAPTLVNVALGYGERRLLVTPEVAADRCVMEALRAHQTLHAELEERELGIFMDEHAPTLAAAMAKLKSTPAPSVVMAKDQFEAAGLPIIRSLEQGLLVRTAELRTQVDTQAELAGLARRCNGRVGWFRDHPNQEI